MNVNDLHVVGQFAENFSGTKPGVEAASLLLIVPAKFEAVSREVSNRALGYGQSWGALIMKTCASVGFEVPILNHTPIIPYHDPRLLDSSGYRLRRRKNRDRTAPRC